MCKVLELNEKTEILSLYSVILLLHPYFPAFPFCFGYYLWNLYLPCFTNRI